MKGRKVWRTEGPGVGLAWVVSDERIVEGGLREGTLKFKREFQRRSETQ